MNISFNVITLAVIILDQISKLLIQKHFQFEGISTAVIPNIFHITFIYNKGAAFGLLENKQWFFILVAIVLIVAAYYLRNEIKKSTLNARYGVAFLLGGAIGNLIDRIVLGKVVDFFDFIIWPIFNIADIAICIGVGLILWSTWTESV